MVNIVTAYLAREILKTSGATILVLYVILVSNAFGRALAEIADGDIPQQALWPVMLSQMINLFSLLLPRDTRRMVSLYSRFIALVNVVMMQWYIK